jgi:hypothetical protein
VSNTPRPPAVFFKAMRLNAPRRASPGMRRLLWVLILALGAAINLEAAPAQVTVDITTWNAGSLSVANIASPGSDFTNPITGPNPTVTMTVRAQANNTNYSIRVRKAADEATTWNGSYQVWICPLTVSANTGTVTWTPPFAIGTWVQVTSTEQQMFVFRTTNRNVIKTITFRLELRGVTVAVGTRAPIPTFTTTLTYNMY